MNPQRHCEITAVLVLVLLSVSGGRRTSFQSGGSARNAEGVGHGWYDDGPKRTATLTAAVKALEPVLASPKLQKHSKLLAEGIHAMLSNQKTHELTRLASVLLKTVMEDPGLREPSKLLAEHVEALTMEDQNFEEHAKFRSELLKAIMEHQVLQEYSKLFAQQVKAMMTDPKVTEMAYVVAKELEAIMTDTSIQNQAKIFAKRLGGMAVAPSFPTHVELIPSQMNEAISGNPIKLMNNESWSLAEMGELRRQTDSTSRFIPAAVGSPYRVGRTSSASQLAPFVTTPAVAIPGSAKPRPSVIAMRSRVPTPDDDLAFIWNSTDLPPISPPQDFVDQAVRALHDAVRWTVPPFFRNFLDVQPGRTLPKPGVNPLSEEAKATLLTSPQLPAVPRPVGLVIAASAPTALGWYGFYKFSVEEELYQAEIRRPGGRATGFGGYGTLLTFTYLFLLSLLCRVTDHPGAADAFFEVASVWILATQVNLYVRVNELCKKAGMEPPVHAWWAILPPPIDVVVGLRQVHFLAQLKAKNRGVTPDPEPVAEEFFPFIGSERFTLEEFVRQPRRWFWFTKDWDDWWQTD